MGHIAYISSHSLLGILVRQFNEASMLSDIGKRDNIRIKWGTFLIICLNSLTLMISVMRLVKNWLINRNVIIADDVLSEIQGLVDAVSGSGELRNLALEVLRLIPDKVWFSLVITDGSFLMISICRHHRMSRFPRLFFPIILNRA